MKKVIFVFDIPDNTYASDFCEFKGDEWEAERHVVKALKELGYDVTTFGIYDNIEEFIKKCREVEPKFVFNLCESYRGDRQLEANVSAVFQLLKIPFVGCLPQTLRLCQDKALSKKILNYHRIRVPKFFVHKRGKKVPELSNELFPVIVKPIDFEGSEGIHKVSIVKNSESANERIALVHEKYQTDAIVEEFIPGREIYVSIMGDKKLKIFPPRELFMPKLEGTEPLLASFRVKWDYKYRKEQGIHNGRAKLSVEEWKKLRKLSKRIYNLLNIHSHARLDFRMRPSGDFALIEVNPNPGLAKTDDFAKSAEYGELTYPEMLKSLIALSV